MVRLIPVYDDSDAVAALPAQLDAVLSPPVDVLVVDDGSTERVRISGPFVRIRRIAVLHLRRDLGHQRAIAVLLGSGIALVGVVAICFGTGLAIPGLATYAAGVFAVIFLQAVMLSLLLVFNVRTARTLLGFLPARYAGLFVLRRTTAWREPAGAENPSGADPGEG